MIKTLRITSIIAAILATFLIVFPAVFGVGRDEEVEKFLKSAGAIENFKKAAGDKTTKGSESQTSPLVSQAQAFALYLNPPKPKLETPPAPQTTVKPRPMAPVAPKFKLVGTSFYPSHPELSLALIDEPATGLRWIRQSSQVGHLVIEQVKDGLVVVRDDTRTFEMPVADRPAKINLLKGASTDATEAKPALSVSDTGETHPAAAIAELPQSDELDNEKSKALEELVDKLKELQAGDEPNSAEADSHKAAMEKIMSEFNASRISNAEAKKLGNLGKDLKSTRTPRPRHVKHGKSSGDPNQIKNSKIEASSPEPSQEPRDEPNSSENK